MFFSSFDNIDNAGAKVTWPLYFSTIAWCDLLPMSSKIKI
jgi:hypothetical protein